MVVEVPATKKLLKNSLQRGKAVNPLDRGGSKEKPPKATFLISKGTIIMQYGAPPCFCCGNL